MAIFSITDFQIDFQFIYLKYINKLNFLQKYYIFLTIWTP